MLSLHQRQTTCLYFMLVRPHGNGLIWQASDRHAKNGLSFLGLLHPVSSTTILCPKYVVMQYSGPQIIAVHVFGIIFAAELSTSTQFCKRSKSHPRFVTRLGLRCTRSWLWDVFLVFRSVQWVFHVFLVWTKLDGKMERTTAMVCLQNLADAPVMGDRRQTTRASK